MRLIAALALTAGLIGGCAATPVPPMAMPEGTSMVRVPASELKRVAAASEMRPPQRLSPLMLRSAPVLEMPVPWRNSGSLQTLMSPCICKA